MSFVAEGGCLCGAIRYRVSAAPFSVAHCHCSNCRKASGAAMLTWLTVKQGEFTWLRGEPKRYRYESEHYPAPVERLFCENCGSQLGWHCLDDGTVDITAGSLDDPGVIDPQRHVFARGRVHWLQLADDLPSFDTTPRIDS
jgi:hypothetical protein